MGKNKGLRGNIKLQPQELSVDPRSEEAMTTEKIRRATGIPSLVEETEAKKAKPTEGEQQG
ncbi:MAG: hypothetical protein UW86_C0029G0009 [Microgenomates group bacterium GW2011_GWA1_Microgenomates_45_10]|nr:MAG: hypothetical protein UW86_C0029G0009 [Microgenomates group bacterium GW2011_GWA1_Microgenomates_45_10]